MGDRLRIALAQLNPTVGALKPNLALARKALGQAADARADILILPELFLAGCFPQDLLLNRHFVDEAIEAAHLLVTETRDLRTGLLLPTVWRERDGQLRNAVIYAERGDILATRFKREMPDGDVFGDGRYFAAGPLPAPIMGARRRHWRADRR